MKIFLLSNPLDAAIKAKILGGGQINITEFPVMELKEIDKNSIPFLFGGMPFASSNYVKMDNCVYRIICNLIGESNEMYITKETGQIIDFVKRGLLGRNEDKLQFINFTQIQTISLKMGVPLKM